MNNDRQHKLYVVIPLLNEEENVITLLRDIRSLKESVAKEFDCLPLIIDDGSTDGTARKIEECRGDLQTTILSHERNMGPGAAFATAFEHLGGILEDSDWIITMEGDNTSRIETLLHMLTRRKEGYDVVLASPYAYGGRLASVDVSRIFLSHGANAIARLILGLWGFHTLSSFFRLYNSGIIRRLQERYGPRIIECTGFECMVELLLKLALIEARVSEVEMLLDWENRRGKSKLRLIPAITGYIKLLCVGWKWR